MPMVFRLPKKTGCARTSTWVVSLSSMAELVQEKKSFRKKVDPYFIQSSKCLLQFLSLYTKGQLISKELFGVIVSTKKTTIFLRISALGSKKSSNQKTLFYNHVKELLISDIKCLNFFDPTSF